HRKIGTEYHALVHPLFEELMDRHAPAAGYVLDGAWDWDKVLATVQANHGSVQGLDFVPEDVRRVLVCAHDIAAADHVRMQAAVQRSFDGGAKVANSISKTINLANEASIDDVFEAYTLAFSSGCKWITVYRDGSRDFQVLSPSSDKPAAQVAADAAAPARGHEPSPAVVPAGPVAGPAQPTPPVRMTSAAVAPPAHPVRSAGGGGPHYDRLPGEPLFDRPLRLHGQ